jgi:flavin-dependent dehydrogenase
VKDVDAIVVGGGPAGSAAAIGLAQSGYSVLILENSGVASGWEIVGRAGRMALEQLGALDRLAGVRRQCCRSVAAAWGSGALTPAGPGFEDLVDGWYVERVELHSVLLDLAQRAGAVVLRDAKPRTLSRRGESWSALVDQATSEFLVESRFLVLATEREAFSASSVPATRLPRDRLIALGAMLEPRHTGLVAPGDILIEAGEEGWWWSAVEPGGSLAVMHFTDLEGLALGGLPWEVFWSVRLGRTRFTLERTDAFQPVRTVSMAPLCTYRLEPAAGPGWVAVGDAAGAHDPLFPDWISYAVETGLHGAQSFGSDRNYAVWIEAEFQRRMEDRVGYYRREQRWSYVPFWRRRHHSGLDGNGSHNCSSGPL